MITGPAICCCGQHACLGAFCCEGLRAKYHVYPIAANAKGLASGIVRVAFLVGMEGTESVDHAETGSPTISFLTESTLVLIVFVNAKKAPQEILSIRDVLMRECA